MAETINVLGGDFSEKVKISFNSTEATAGGSFTIGKVTAENSTGIHILKIYAGGQTEKMFIPWTAIKSITPAR